MRRILDIGHGGVPIGLGTLRHFSRILPPDTAYYGIDLPVKKQPIEQNPREAQMLELESEYKRFSPQNIFLFHMDARNLGFRNWMFDEVHLHWIVTAPGVSVGDVWDMMRESARVLRRGGSCIITGEEVGTAYSDMLWLMKGHIPFKHDESKDALEKASVFSNIVIANQELFAPNGFILVARKVD